MKTIRRGDRGPFVEAAQLALTRAGYPTATDGIFGQNTYSAVTAFQSANALPPDGIIGPQTQRKLIPFLKGYTLHTVKPGDTYFSLAERYGSTVAAISAANPSAIPENLRIGTTLTIPYAFPLVPTGISYTSELVSFIAEGLRARYPFVASTSYGKSSLGRDLPLLIMGTGDTEVFYNASHHANEWITTPVLLKFLEEYAAAYAFGGDLFGFSAAYLFDKVTLYIAPLVNPDGIDLVTGAVTDGDPGYSTARAISENYPSIPFPSGWKANILGTDLNLNYPAGWEMAKEIKYAQGFVSPSPRDFVGVSPLSAKESLAVYLLTRRYNFALTLSYHSQGEIIYWKYLDYLPPDSYEIALKMSAASGYLLEETPYASGFAGYKDWFIQEFNLPGYTIEVGLGSSPLPLSQFDKIYRDNIGILALGMAAV